MQCNPSEEWKYDTASNISSFASIRELRNFAMMERAIEMDGISAMQWAREISKLPQGCFTLCFFPYSRSQGMAGEDGDGEPRMCYRILIRYMGFPQDGYKLHKINWL